jgi:dihydrofolate reductase
MSKIILSMMVSVDGYTEGPDHDLSWHVWDGEMTTYMIDFFSTVDTFIYGRRSYELMLGYWPSQTDEFARIMNVTPKIVFSNTLEKVKWNSVLAKGRVADEIKALKARSDKDKVLFAGADLASTFISGDLIDEYRLIVNPVVLGKGTPLFKETQRLPLRLVETKTFSCGNILLRYLPQNHT